MKIIKNPFNISDMEAMTELERINEADLKLKFRSANEVREYMKFELNRKQNIDNLEDTLVKLIHDAAMSGEYYCSFHFEKQLDEDIFNKHLKSRMLDLNYKIDRNNTEYTISWRE